MLPGVFYALLAGFLAALASSSAKLSLGADHLKEVCETGLKIWTDRQASSRDQGLDNTVCDWVRSLMQTNHSKALLLLPRSSHKVPVCVYYSDLSVIMVFVMQPLNWLTTGISLTRTIMTIQMVLNQRLLYISYNHAA